MDESRSGRQPASGDIATVGADTPITLGQFVKLAGIASTGGEAKQAIGLGLVRVNGQVETRRGRKLSINDIVEVGDRRARLAPRSEATALTGL